MYLVDAISQTYPDELALLSNYAAGAGVALEIGSFQGVSSALIAKALRDGGVLYCVDPWPERDGKADPSFAIFERHTRRRKVNRRIRVLRGTSQAMADYLPRDIDFMFIDGDHGKEAIAADWSLAKALVRPGGHVCLHDAIVPESEPWRTLPSSEFFNDVIRHDPEFVLVASRHTMAVMRRL